MKHHYSCPLEDEVGRALERAGIKFSTNQRLDFYLPDFDIYLEVKRYDTPRVLSQLESQENIILIQGKKSVAAFVNLLSKNKKHG